MGEVTFPMDYFLGGRSLDIWVGHAQRLSENRHGHKSESRQDQFAIARLRESSRKVA
jgi:hypothetical protein